MPVISVNIRLNDRRVAVSIDTLKTISEFKVLAYKLRVSVLTPAIGSNPSQ